MPRRVVALDDEARVLTMSRRRCCLCAYVEGDWSERDGQIAHLDHNPENPAFVNLVWLCLRHHSAYDSRTSQHKNYTVAEVRVHRDRLYEEVAERIGQIPPIAEALIVSGCQPQGNQTGAESVVAEIDAALAEWRAFRDTHEALNYWDASRDEKVRIITRLQTTIERLATPGSPHGRNAERFPLDLQAPVGRTADGLAGILQDLRREYGGS